MHVENGLLGRESVRVREQRSEVGQEILHVLGLELPGAVEALDARLGLDPHGHVVVAPVEQVGAQRRERNGRLPGSALADDEYAAVLRPHGGAVDLQVAARAQPPEEDLAQRARLVPVRLLPCVRDPVPRDAGIAVEDAQRLQPRPVDAAQASLLEVVQRPLRVAGGDGRTRRGLGSRRTCVPEVDRQRGRAVAARVHDVRERRGKPVPQRLAGEAKLDRIVGEVEPDDRRRAGGLEARGDARAKLVRPICDRTRAGHRAARCRASSCNDGRLGCRTVSAARASFFRQGSPGFGRSSRRSASRRSRSATRGGDFENPWSQFRR